MPSELSGGMTKRVALARALALDPELVFLDEPTSGLDPISAGEFDDLIVTLQHTLGLTVFMVTHDLETLRTVCDRVAALADGKVVAIGDMATMLRSEHPWMRMRRFDQSDLLSTRAARGEIDADLATEFAYAVFATHQMANPATRSSGVSAYQDLVSSIVGALRETRLFSKPATEQLTAGLERQLQVAAHIIDERAREGFVRRCHGDLHLANIVMWHGRRSSTTPSNSTRHWPPSIPSMTSPSCSWTSSFAILGRLPTWS